MKTLGRDAPSPTAGWRARSDTLLDIVRTQRNGFNAISWQDYRDFAPALQTRKGSDAGKKSVAASCFGASLVQNNLRVTLGGVLPPIGSDIDEAL